MSTYRDEVTDGEINQLNQFSDFPEYDQLAEKLSHKLFSINGAISTLEQFVETLEEYNNDRSTVSIKSVERITKKSVLNIEKVTTELKEANDDVHNLTAIDHKKLDAQRLISREKLLRDVNFSFQEFQNCQIKLKKLTESINREAKAVFLPSQEENLIHIEDETNQNSAIGDVPNNNLTNQGQTQTTMLVEREDLNNEELVYHQNLIRERDEEITNIQNGITELNSIFQDLNTMVLEQGQLVDNIESNIYSVATDTQEASKHLRKAMISQKRRSKIYIYIFVVLLVFVFFTILLM